MALPKLPCEYPELQKARWKECFGDFTEEEQIELMKKIIKISEVCEV